MSISYSCPGLRAPAAAVLQKEVSHGVETTGAEVGKSTSLDLSYDFKSYIIKYNKPVQHVFNYGIFKTPDWSMDFTIQHQNTRQEGFSQN